MGTQGYIGTWLRERLKTIGKSQRWLSKESGVPEATLSELINNKIQLEAGTAEKLSRVRLLSITAAQLLNIAGQISLSSEEELTEDAGVFARIFARMSAKSKETAKSLLLALESQDRGEEDNGKHDKPGKRRRT